MPDANVRALLRSRPVGEPRPSDFEIAESPIPKLGPGQILCRTPPGPNITPLLVNRALINGFIVSDQADRLPDFLRDCTPWVREGQLKYREDIVEGLAATPDAFIGLLKGQNFGKLLVRVSADPTRT